MLCFIDMFHGIVLEDSLNTLWADGSAIRFAVLFIVACDQMPNPEGRVPSRVFVDFGYVAFVIF